MGEAPSTGRIWLVRHAESVWNAAGRWQGQGDPPLSQVGRDQARRLAARLRSERIDRVLASDLRRAEETARALARASGAVLELDPDWRERDLGVWAGLEGAEIEARWPEELRRLREGDPTLRPGGGETLAELRERVARAWARVRAQAAREVRVVVVTHLGVLRLLCPGWVAGNAEARALAKAPAEPLLAAAPPGSTRRGR